MGEQHVHRATDPAIVRGFTRAMLADLAAFERMLAEGLFETGARRYGMEQEMFLVDAQGRPAPVGPALLASCDDPRLTHELGRFNLEGNLPPGDLGPRFLSALRLELRDVLRSATEHAAPHGARPLLTGILPTLHGADFAPEQMSPSPRYRQLNDNLLAHRGGEMVVFIRGVDELHRRQSSVMLEAANASLQLHLQVDPDDFVAAYNAAQLISAPLLAVAAASPILLGRRLWHETRIALFELSVDARSQAELARGLRPRVGFGDDWLRGDLVDLFRADVSRYRVLLTRDPGPDPLRELDAERVPELRALTLHNGTVWRWNRPCYGIAEGVPHLRVENRVLPSGPSIPDEIANAALFYGLMLVRERFGDVPARLPFHRAKGAFLAAARHGLDAQLPWLDGRVVGAAELIGRELLPLAREGLRSVGLPRSEIDTVLEPIEERVDRSMTAASWMLDAFEQLAEPHGREQATRFLTQALLDRQASGEPLHRWRPVDPSKARGGPLEVRHVMLPDVSTVHPEDPIELVEAIGRWEGTTFVVVEAVGEVVGLVGTAEEAGDADAGRDVRVADRMAGRFATIHPDAPLPAARAALEEAEPACLVVISDGRAIGLVTPAALDAAEHG